ncbi:ABC transporter permease [Paenibacillus sp. HB172176]|uniref:ABC transporter permease n=1 Tax=Paenibacillus sp. HB172176 TaxID=2493690 RepID=UPI001439EC08|nr:ABC transporter permease [Paenibacillus sp. HB172176]
MKSMNLFQNKITWLGIAAIFVFILLLGLAQIGSVSNPVPKRMPVALVMEDHEVEMANGQKLAVGEMIQEQLTTLPEDGSVPTLEWDILPSEEAAMDALDHMDDYAAVIIPESLSESTASLLDANPQQGAIQIYINQGKNATGASMVSLALSKIGDGINQQLRMQMMEAVKAQGDQLNTAQASSLASPIQFEIQNVNEVPAHSANGNAPVSFTILAWFGAIIATVMLFLASSKARNASKSNNMAVILSQSLLGLLYAAAGACATLLLAKGMLGMEIPDTAEFFLYFMLISYSFFLMQSCLTNWLGLKGMPIFILVFFFGSPVLTLPEQLLPTLSHNWLFSWMPLRFSVDIFRDLLYFGKGFNIGGPLTILAAIAVVALLLSFLSAFKNQTALKDSEATEVTGSSVGALE